MSDLGRRRSRRVVPTADWVYVYIEEEGRKTEVIKVDRSKVDGFIEALRVRRPHCIVLNLDPVSD